jgi:hypothetical protein
VGVLVTFESKEMLLQREDFPAALRALKKCANEFYDPEAVRRAKDLQGALKAADFVSQLDAHGDLVGLHYAGDKVPSSASDDWPGGFMVAWKKWLRASRFHRAMEGTRRRTFFADRGVVRAQDQYDSERRRFEQIGADPRCRPGEQADVSFRYVSDFEDDAAAVEVPKPSDDGALSIDFTPRTMRPGDEARATLRVRDGRDGYGQTESVFLHASAPPDVLVRGFLGVAVDLPEDLDTVHTIVAHTSSPQWLGTYLPSKKAKAALEDMHRYAARNANAPGGAFLTAVAEAKTVDDALGAAGFEPTRGGGHITSLAFTGDRLAGSERLVIGFLRAFAGLTTTRLGELRVAYAAIPDWWTVFSLAHGDVTRSRARRAP